MKIAASLLVLFCLACSTSDENPVAPSGPQPFAGTWNGQAVIDGCRRLAGPGPSACRFLIGQVQSLELILTQNRDAVVGTIKLNRTAIGAVNGRASGAQVFLQASMNRDEDRGQFSIRHWELRLSDDQLLTDALVEMEEQSNNIFGPQSLILTYSIGPLQR